MRKWHAWWQRLIAGFPVNKGGAMTTQNFWPLLKALGAPDHCTEFHLIAKVDSPVMIQATFYAPGYERDAEGKIKMITESYYLAKTEDVVELDDPL